MAYKVFTVSEINNSIKDVVEGAFSSGIYVEGEISDYKKSSSGHIYFTVSDEQSRLSCVMWRYKAAHMPGEIRQGTYVIIRGRLNVYAPGGSYSLSADTVEIAGEGLKKIKLAQLKKKFQAEGLFDNKRPLPFLPSVVGVVTAENGAAFRDIVKVLRRRNPGGDIILTPCAVQGADAPRSIVEAVALQNRFGKAEVLIVGRGGGGSEDLSAFDHEDVVRAVAGSSIPVVSAVGHEIDYSLTDLAADVRAETPSSAAEKVMPHIALLEADVDQKLLRLSRAVEAAADHRRNRMEYISRRLHGRSPERLLGGMNERLVRSAEEALRSMDVLLREKENALGRSLEKIGGFRERFLEREMGRAEKAAEKLAYLAPRTDMEKRRGKELKDRLFKACGSRLEDKKSDLAMAVSGLDSRSPLGVLARGYALVRKEDRMSGNAGSLETGDAVKILFSDGEADAKITKVTKIPEGGISEYIRGKD